MTVTIVLVDDHPVVRAGLRALLAAEPDMAVVGDAADPAAARELVASARPDVVLMDLNLGPGIGGAELTAQLRELPHPPQVLVLTTYDTEADIMAALRAGAVGFLLKDAPPDELYRAVRATAEGHSTLAAPAAALLVRRAGGPAPALSGREIEILGELAAGRSNKDIARRLFVSEATVKSHLSHIYTKLGVDTRAGAVARAIDQRVIRPG